MIIIPKAKKAIKTLLKRGSLPHDTTASSVKGSKALSSKAKTSSNPVDCEVLIIGAGIAGIGMACRLQQKDQNLFSKKRRELTSNSNTNKKHETRASQRFIVLEKRADIGGTWDLFKYPGIRSDSDALTFGYSFRPWLDHKMIAKGADIKSYISDTAKEFKVTEHIRYRHEVQQLSWSSKDQRWTATIKNYQNNETSEFNENGEILTLTANFIVGATGYYDFEQGYRPHFTGEDDFAGLIVHPQQWQEVNYHHKKVVIIGSGATAMTLLPALVDQNESQSATHVTMLQRSPSYVASVPADDYAMDKLSGKFSPLSKQQAYKLVRGRNVLMQQATYRASLYAPKVMKALMAQGVKKELKGSDIDLKHFSPDYNPWDQRVCAVPDSDFFKALQSSQADVVTDEIERFTETGILLKSGRHLQADIIVTATGLKLQVLGGAKVVVDEQIVDIGSRMTYKAVMLEQVPNMAVMFGYTNASWTLKIDLACQYVIRLLSYMNANNYQSVIAKAESKTKKNKTEKPQMQPDTVMGALSSGYVQRAKDELPKQGDRYPWEVMNNYLLDRVMLKYRKINDEWLRFTR